LARQTRGADRYQHTYQLGRLRLHHCIVSSNACPKVSATRSLLPGFASPVLYPLLQPHLPAWSRRCAPRVTRHHQLKRTFDALTAQVDAMRRDASLAAQKLTHSHRVSFINQGLEVPSHEVSSDNKFRFLPCASVSVLQCAMVACSVDWV